MIRELRLKIHFIWNWGLGWFRANKEAQLCRVDKNKPFLQPAWLTEPRNPRASIESRSISKVSLCASLILKNTVFAKKIKIMESIMILKVFPLSKNDYDWLGSLGERHNHETLTWILPFKCTVIWNSWINFLKFLDFLLLQFYSS